MFGQEQFIGNLKSILGELIDTTRLHEELEIWHHVVGQFLSDNLANVILGIIAAVIAPPRS